MPLSQNILQGISNLADNDVLSRQIANQLESTCQLYQQLTQILKLKLGISGPFDPEKSPPGLTRLINAATASPDFATSQEMLENAQKAIAEIFRQLLLRHTA